MLALLAALVAHCGPPLLLDGPKVASGHGFLTREPLVARREVERSTGSTTPEVGSPARLPQSFVATWPGTPTSVSLAPCEPTPTGGAASNYCRLCGLTLDDLTAHYSSCAQLAHGACADLVFDLVFDDYASPRLEAFSGDSLFQTASSDASASAAMTMAALELWAPMEPGNWTARSPVHAGTHTLPVGPPLRSLGQPGRCLDYRSRTLAYELALFAAFSAPTPAGFRSRRDRRAELLTARHKYRHFDKWRDQWGRGDHQPLEGESSVRLREGSLYGHCWHVDWVDLPSRARQRRRWSALHPPHIPATAKVLALKCIRAAWVAHLATLSPVVALGGLHYTVCLMYAHPAVGLIAAAMWSPLLGVMVFCSLRALAQTAWTPFTTFGAVSTWCLSSTLGNMTKGVDKAFVSYSKRLTAAILSNSDLLDGLQRAATGDMSERSGFFADPHTSVSARTVGMSWADQVDRDTVDGVDCSELPDIPWVAPSEPATGTAASDQVLKARARHDTLISRSLTAQRRRYTILLAMVTAQRIVYEAHLCLVHKRAVYCSAQYFMMYSATVGGIALEAARALRPICFSWAIAAVIPYVTAMENDNHAYGSRPPMFDGTRVNFVSFLISFTGWIAWKLTDCADILDGTSARPDPDEVEQAVVNAWDALNKKLYGAVVAALPDYLRTSVFNDYRNDGAGAIAFLRDTYDAVSPGDHAAHMQKLQAHYIDARSDISEDDLRMQYDSMMVAKAGIIRCGNEPPVESALIAMFDNALPITYSQIRQLVRRERHETLVAHFSDYMSNVRAEMAARGPTVRAFSASSNAFLPQAPGGGQPRRERASKSSSSINKERCLRCGEEGHKRPNCNKTPRKCRTPGCGGDHADMFCPKGNGEAYQSLSFGAKNILRRDTGKRSPSNGKPSARAAVTAGPSQTPAAPPQGTPAAGTDGATHAAHAAAAAAASGAGGDVDAAAGAYAAALRSMGFGMCAHAKSASAMSPPKLPEGVSPPRGTTLLKACIDSMATFWVVPSRDLLCRVTNENPNLSVETADGDAKVQAIGDISISFLTSAGWRQFYVRQVLVLDNCDAVLYSTRVMRDHFRFSHDIDHGNISMPDLKGKGTGMHISVHDDGAAFVIPVCFHKGDTYASICRIPGHITAMEAALRVAGTAAFPAGVSGTTQATLFHRLGFHYEQQWRHVPSQTTGHGLPPDTIVSTILPVREAVQRGRARAAPFTRKPELLDEQPAPGAKIYMDFAGMLLKSFPHGFVCYCGAVDAGSGYGRLFPAFGMTAQVAAASLGIFIADIGGKLGLMTAYKPLVVRSDQGSAFTAHAFREFLGQRQIPQSLANTYTPKQNTHIERFWGIVFATARVLLAAANLPPTFHPFALQTAAWITARLPRPSRGNRSPVTILTRAPAQLAGLYTFGCLCAITLHEAWRDGDRHLADRGEYAIYLGPSEETPGSVVFLLSSRRVTTVPRVRVWEDNFPGVKGHSPYTWFPPSTAAVESTADGEDVDSVPDGQRSSSMSGGGTDPGPESRGGQPPSTSGGGDRAADQHALPLAGEPAVSSTPSAVNPAPDKLAAPPLRARSPSRSDGATSSLPSVGEHYDRHPEASNPASVHFQRRHPRRSTRTQVPSYAERATTVVSMAFLTNLCESSGASVPTYLTAYESALLSIDGMADIRSQEDELSLVDAALQEMPSLAVVYSFATTQTADLGEIVIPSGMAGVFRSPQRAQWLAAIAKEIQGLVDMQTWELIPRADMPTGANLMRCHFIFTVKRNADGSIEKFKARLVADGNTQKAGVDFDRVFSTVIKSQTIRLVLAIAAAEDWNTSSIDIRQAYLQADLDSPLYMMVPPCISPYDQQGRPLVCQLRRSLYGLRQAGRAWATLFASFLESWGFVRSTIDVCLFTYATGNLILWVLIWVDDAIIIDNDEGIRKRFVADLSKRFPTEDKGELKWILGMAISRDRARRSMVLSLELYITDLLSKFGSHIAGTSRTYNTPFPEGLNLTPEDCPKVGSAEHDDMALYRVAYMSLVGGLMWVANMVCAEIAFAVSQLARALSNPARSHWNGALRVLCYLQTSRRTLTFTPDSGRGLEVYVDASWLPGYSCSGAMFFFHGCLFAWFSKTQKSVSLSSAEAEYFAAMVCARDTLFYREVLVELRRAPAGPTVTWTDSKGVVDLSQDPVAFKQTKHILRAANFLRDLVEKLHVRMVHVPGISNLADLMTKAVSRPVFISLLKLLDSYAAQAPTVPAPAARIAARLAAAPRPTLRFRGGGGGDGGPLPFAFATGSAVPWQSLQGLHLLAETACELCDIECVHCRQTTANGNPACWACSPEPMGPSSTLVVTDDLACMARNLQRWMISHAAARPEPMLVWLEHSPCPRSIGGAHRLQRCTACARPVNHCTLCHLPTGRGRCACVAAPPTTCSVVGRPHVGVQFQSNGSQRSGQSTAPNTPPSVDRSSAAPPAVRRRDANARRARSTSSTRPPLLLAGNDAGQRRSGRRGGPAWASCCRLGCPCTASWNGQAGEYCCATCRDGQPCRSNYHPRPFVPTQGVL